ncbi:hypothetical protein FRX31_008050 [Thalictrum thalictroides]|uniref:Pectinesterase inhibitor domain-containing protein n=1 Tax=Thalictrum thalictroides TaxID=46969 RepID=A0A7J6X016_THATH|nr:hypothetical protein FRX31_008050 [Thalictrum thalictroides]
MASSFLLSCALLFMLSCVGAKGHLHVQYVKDECYDAGATYYDLCVSSLSSEPRISKAGFADFPSFSMEISLANATAIRWNLQSNLKTDDAATKRCIVLCIKHFDVAISNIRNAISSFSFSIDPIKGTSAISFLISAQEHVKICQEQLKTHGVLPALVPKVEISNHLIHTAYDLIMYAMI